VQIDHLFGGSSLCAVDRHGRVRLPRFVRSVVERRAQAAALVVGAHDSDPCLIAYDPGFRRFLFADSERLRLRGEEAGHGEEVHHQRLRRMFGLSEEAAIDPAGSIRLPPLMRRLGSIEDLALLVGTGGAFEIWNPHLAARSADEGLSALARFRLAEADPDRNRMEEPS
jgi:DNA-binding transcriptional regulator/RsmH inhibitor MraZ